MDIRLISGSYKSFTALEWLDVPMFAVVTGANGAGKTQLLELIAWGAGIQRPPEGTHYTAMHQPPRIDAKVLLNPSLSSREVAFHRSAWPAVGATANVQSVIEMANRVWGEKTNRPAQDAAWNHVWSSMQEMLGKRRDEITREEFDRALPPNFPLLSETGGLETSIPVLFVSYLLFIESLQQVGRAIEEIKRELSPLPWDALNDVLESAGLSYRVVEPNLTRYERFRVRDFKYDLALEDRETGQQIAPSDLSSGERVMFLVALWLFSFSQRQAANLSSRANRLLLLDEPDAHLHPALTKSFLRAIRLELVEKHGIRVIMTTHAPSTVALAPNDSVFVMQRQTPRIRRATSKWDAVAQLTAGFVAIGTESKCIFVEGTRDREFYSMLQTLLVTPGVEAAALDPSRPILFISADSAHPGQGKGRPSGGKENVRKWVEAIQSTQIAGIIDRDGGNVGGERIHVLGRHDLEAYLLDPLFLYAVLLEEKKAPTVAGVALSVHDGRQLLRQEPVVLQALIDAMSAEMRSVHPNCPVATDPVPVRYHNGPELLLERWLVASSGKPLLQPLRERFGVALNDPEYLMRRYHVIEIVPEDLVAMLQAIQAA